LVNSDDKVFTARALENIRESIKAYAKDSVDYCELKQHKLKFD